MSHQLWLPFAGMAWAIIGSMGIVHFHNRCAHTAATGLLGLKLGVFLGGMLGPLVWLVEWQRYTTERNRQRSSPRANLAGRS